MKALFKYLMIALLLCLINGSAWGLDPLGPDAPIEMKCSGVKESRRIRYDIALTFAQSKKFRGYYSYNGYLTKRQKKGDTSPLLVRFKLKGQWKYSGVRSLDGAGYLDKLGSRNEYAGLLAIKGGFLAADPHDEEFEGESDKWLLEFTKANEKRTSLRMWCELKSVKYAPVPVTPTPTPTPVQDFITTNNWSGKWVCTGPGDATLTIGGRGASSTMRADFATAEYGPAYDEYTFEAVSAQSASGMYVYHNHYGPGLWNGAFSLIISDDKILLERQDLSSSWHGSYKCSKTS